MKKTLLILTMFLATTAFDCGSKRNAAPPVAPDVTQKTSNGVTVISRGGQSEEVLKTIAEATADLIEDEKVLGFTVDLDPSIYTVGIVAECELDASGIMSFRIRADDYDGSIYDKNPAKGIGEVLAAERVLMNGVMPSNSFQICPDRLEVMRNTTRYGEEHIALSKNNYFWYLETANHAGGQGHPLIPSRAQ